MVHHELKTPLTSIKGCAQLMQRRGAYSEWAVNAIVMQVDHLTQVIDNLLDVLCLEDGRSELRPAVVDLTALARAAVDKANQRSDQHAVSLEAPAEPLIGRWDRAALAQVLDSLLSNAIRYSPTGGEIRVRLERHGHEAAVSVTDQGIGIAPADLPRVFERFYRVDDPGLWPAQGLGLGLYCAKLLIEWHGGRIWAESAPGRGSNFFFTLPLGSPETEPANAADR